MYCPTCEEEYIDPSYKYCPIDGDELVEELNVLDEEAEDEEGEEENIDTK